MSKIQVWQIKPTGPIKVSLGEIDLEEHLEIWIEKDPNLLQGGLEIIGRQLHLFGNKLRLDLLALNPQGEWVLIELKQGRLYGDVITQVLNYAAILSSMPYAELEQLVDVYLESKGKTLRSLLQARNIDPDNQPDRRDVQLIVAGVNKDPVMERLVDFLSGSYNVPINIVSFGVHRLDSGELILTRDDEEIQQAVPSGSKITVDMVCEMADKNGIGPEFRSVLEAAQSLDIYPRAYTNCIMYAPQQNKARALFTVWNRLNADHKIGMYVGARVFPEFYPVSEETALRILGEEESQGYSPDQIGLFIEKLRELFTEIQKHMGAGATS